MFGWKKNISEISRKSLETKLNKEDVETKKYYFAVLCYVSIDMFTKVLVSQASKNNETARSHAETDEVKHSHPEFSKQFGHDKVRKKANALDANSKIIDCTRVTVITHITEQLQEEPAYKHCTRTVLEEEKTGDEYEWFVNGRMMDWDSQLMEESKRQVKIFEFGI